MSHPSPSEHGVPAAPVGSAGVGPMSFSTAEWDEMRSEDKFAAAAIVGLMMGIFSLGVVGYLIVCWWVS